MRKKKPRLKQSNFKRPNLKRVSLKRPSKLNQVRIIGGQFKRRNVDFIDLDGLRPTPDRMRETLFNWLMSDIYEANVLDACAGSGVLGFEALSRGAAKVTFIEANQQQYQQLQASAQQLKISPEQAQIYHGRAEEVINHWSDEQPAFDLVFLDPPYALNLWQIILNSLLIKQKIHAQTLIYIESDRAIETLFPEGIYIDNRHYQPEILREKNMGQAYSALIRLKAV